MSGIGIATKRLRTERYRASPYYLRKEENLIEIHFVITKNLEAHVTVC